MNIVMIRPPTIISNAEVRPGASPPLGLAYVAGSLRHAGHCVSVVDAIGEALDTVRSIESAPGISRYGLSDEDVVSRIPRNAELIGVSCMFSTEWPITRNLINHIRQDFPNVKIVAGGEHITACSNYAMEDCLALDYCGLGEGEMIMVDLANALAEGNDLCVVDSLVYRKENSLIFTPRRQRMRDIDSFPLPAWELLPIQNYMEHGAMPGVNIGRSIPLLASRGCPYECTFCSNPTMWGRLWKPREPQQVLDEMKLYINTYQVTNFDFYDLTAIVRKEWTIEMANLIIENNLNITWQLPSGTRSEALAAGVVELLYNSGCRNVIYAPESGSDYMLDMIKKRINKDAMAKSIHLAVQTGIKTKANFIVGFPDEKLSHVFESYRFSLRLAFAGLHDASFFPFSPYPGSALFDRLQKEGKVALSDKHFYNLARNPNSYSQYIPNWLLPILTSLGILLFYSTSFSIRPQRIVSLIKALQQGKPQTRLESALLRILSYQTMTTPPDFSIILPVYNQADHIESLIEEYVANISQLNTSFELILVVNASKDQSYVICQALSQKIPQVRSISLKESGWGRAVRAGLSESHGKIVCYTNSARTAPERLCLFLRYGLHNPGVVIKANRRRNKDTYMRRFGSLLYNVLCRLLFDLPMWDINGTPKVFPAPLIAQMNLQFDNDLIDLEFNVRCHQLNVEMLEVPAFFTPRHGGRSTTNLRSAAKLYWGAFRFWMQERSYQQQVMPLN